MKKNKKFIFSVLALSVFIFVVFYGINLSLSKPVKNIVYAEESYDICPVSPNHNKIVDASNKAVYAQTLGYIKASHPKSSEDNYSAKIDSSGNFSGFVYSQTSGWISMDGVKVGCSTGNLSGTAYGQTIGYINFGASGSQPAPKIDPTTGSFSGFAYSQTAGWISLDGWKVASLSVELTASPSTVNYGGTTTLTAETSGTATVENYKFYCDEDDGNSRCDGSSNTCLCDYNTLGSTKKPKVVATDTDDGLSAEDTAFVTVNQYRCVMTNPKISYNPDCTSSSCGQKITGKKQGYCKSLSTGEGVDLNNCSGVAPRFEYPSGTINYCASEATKKCDPCGSSDWIEN